MRVRKLSEWSWDLGEKMTTGIGYEAAIGALAGEGEVAAYIHFGFTLELAHEALPITLVVTSGPSLDSEDTFGDYDMGGNIPTSRLIQCCDSAC